MLRLLSFVYAVALLLAAGMAFAGELVVAAVWTGLVTAATRFLVRDVLTAEAVPTHVPASWRVDHL